MTIFEQNANEAREAIRDYYLSHIELAKETIQEWQDETGCYSYEISLVSAWDEFGGNAAEIRQADPVGWEAFCENTIIDDINDFCCNLAIDRRDHADMPNIIELWLGELEYNEQMTLDTFCDGTQLEEIREQYVCQVAAVAREHGAKAYLATKKLVRELPLNGKAYEIRMTKDGEVYADLDDDNALSLGSASGKDTWLGCVRMGESDE